jgi:hypothetical protein
MLVTEFFVAWVSKTVACADNLLGKMSALASCPKMATTFLDISKEQRTSSLLEFFYF